MKKPTMEQYNEDGITEEFWDDPVQVVRELWREQKSRPISFKMVLAAILVKTGIDCDEVQNAQDEWVLDFWIDTARIDDKRKYECVCAEIPKVYKGMKRRNWNIVSFLGSQIPNVFCSPI